MQDLRPRLEHPDPPALPPGAEMARGTLLGLAALVAANLRSVFPLLVAWTLGPSGLGAYGLAWALTNLASKVGTFGLDQTTAAWVGRDRNAAGRVLHVAARWGVFLSGACSAAALALLACAGALGLAWTTLDGPVALMLCALPGIALYRISNGVSRGRRLLQHDILSRGLVESLATIGAFLAALAAGAGLYAPAIAVIAGTGGGGLVAYGLARRALPGPARQDAAQGLVRFSAPVAAWSLVTLLATQLDVVLLGAFVGRAISLETFGIYCAAFELAQGLRKTRQLFDPAFLPLVAEQAGRPDRGELLDTLRRTTRWLLNVTLPALAVVLCAAGALLSLYGTGFRQGALWLAALALAHSLNAFVGLAETVILTLRPGLVLGNAVAVTAFQALLALLLIPRWGPLAAASVVLLGYIAQGVLRYVQLHGLFGWSWPWDAVRQPAVAFAGALVAGLATRSLVPDLAGEAASATAALAAYAALWWAQGGLERSDRDALAAALSRRRAA